MIEELLDDGKFLSLPRSRQAETIEHHCRGIAERIRKAPDAVEALQIVHSACDDFESECASRIIRTSLRNHLIGIYEQTWMAKRQ